VTVRLEPEDDPPAPLFLASIEGMYLLTAIGRGDLAHSTAAELVRTFSSTSD